MIKEVELTVKTGTTKSRPLRPHLVTGTFVELFHVNIYLYKFLIQFFKYKELEKVGLLGGCSETSLGRVRRCWGVVYRVNSSRILLLNFSHQRHYSMEKIRVSVMKNRGRGVYLYTVSKQ